MKGVLRLKDNPLIYEALNMKGSLVFCYVIDKHLGKSWKLNFPRISNPRYQFLIESLTDLRKQLRDLGSDLVIRVGNEIQEIVKIYKELNQMGKVTYLYHYVPVFEEESNQQRITEQIGTENVIKVVKGKYVISPSKLFQYVPNIPYGEFRQIALSNIGEHLGDSQCCLVPPDDYSMGNLEKPPLECGYIPSGEDLNIKFPERFFELKGGETNAWKQLDDFIDLRYEQYSLDRNSLNRRRTSGLSAYLAQGNLSYRQVLIEVINRSLDNSILSENCKGIASNNYKRNNFDLFFSQLLWNTYLASHFIKYKRSMFTYKAFKSQATKNSMNAKNTGFGAVTVSKSIHDLIRAITNELRFTGFISNKARLILACYCINKLEVHPILLGEFMETFLVDYDPINHWGNIAYCSGITSNSRYYRRSNITTVGNRVDPSKEYRNIWLNYRPKSKSSPHIRSEVVDSMLG